jgi:hypothetical protein
MDAPCLTLSPELLSSETPGHDLYGASRAFANADEGFIQAVEVFSSLPNKLVGVPATDISIHILILPILFLSHCQEDTSFEKNTAVLSWPT